MQTEYTITMPEFLANGGDGYSMFKKEGVKTILDEETASRMIGICKEFFKNMCTDDDFNPKRALARQIRMREFNVDAEDEICG